jgi:predicted DsbA family dithiol-disulfide isomerase
MAVDENLSLLEHQFTTNSRSALRLAEATKFYNAEMFYRLHDRLFEAFFADGENIGDLDVLRRIGQKTGLTEEQMERAWRDEAVEERLQSSEIAARELGVRATPTFFIGEKRLDGAVPYQQLLDAARCSV